MQIKRIPSILIVGITQILYLYKLAYAS
jgi:hypothetical protein